MSTDTNKNEKPFYEIGSNQVRFGDYNSWTIHQPYKQYHIKGVKAPCGVDSNDLTEVVASVVENRLRNVIFARHQAHCNGEPPHKDSQPDTDVEKFTIENVGVKYEGPQFVENKFEDRRDYRSGHIKIFHWFEVNYKISFPFENSEGERHDAEVCGCISVTMSDYRLSNIVEVKGGLPTGEIGHFAATAHATNEAAHLVLQDMVEGYNQYTHESF